MSWSAGMSRDRWSASDQHDREAQSSYRRKRPACLKLQSINEGRLIGFEVFDPQGRQLDSRRDDDAEKLRYRDFVSWRKVMMFPSLCILYVGLAAVSLLVGALIGLDMI